MGWLRDRGEALKAAAEVRRYVIGGVVSIAIALYDHAAPRLEAVGMSAIAGLPSWVVGLFVAVGLVAWWLLEYVVRLRRTLAPKLSVSFRPDHGCIVTTPMKQVKRTTKQDGTVIEETDEFNGLYVRALVTAESETTVREVTPYLVSVRKKDKATGIYLNTRYVDDLQLNWSNIARGQAIPLPKGVRRYFDIVDITERRVRIDPCAAWPLTLRGLFEEATTYELAVVVAGDGVTHRMVFEIIWDGTWNGITGKQVEQT